MKLLIVADKIGEGASGIVVEQLLKELCTRDVDLYIISRINKTKNLPCSFRTEIPHPLLSGGNLWKIKLITFNKDLSGHRWANIGFKNIRNEIEETKFDWTICFAAGYPYHILELSYRLAFATNSKFHIHGLDAMPSPKAWGENQYLRNAKAESLKPYFQKCDSYSLTNPEMLEYQRSIMDVEISKPSFVLPNPVNNSFISSKREGKDEVKVVYTGNLNDKRNGKELVKAISLLRNDRNNIHLTFVGTDQKHIRSYFKENTLPSYIEVVDWTPNPEKYIQEASVLVDIDLPYEGDVFMSSKLIKYLNTNIPVLSITSKNSPASNLLSQLNYGVKISGNKAKEISDKLLQAKKVVKTNNIEKEREQVLKEFNPKAIINKMLKNLFTY